MTIHPPPSSEYKIAKGWAIFIYVFIPGLIALFIWLFIQSFINPEFKGGIGWFFMAVAPPMIIGMAIGIKDTYVRQLIINNHSITSIGAFSQRELQFHEIKGFMVRSGTCLWNTDSKHRFFRAFRVSTIVSNPAL